jgi:hypothetical protein
LFGVTETVYVPGVEPVREIELVVDVPLKPDGTPHV